jgi:hypothetical protein
VTDGTDANSGDARSSIAVNDARSSVSISKNSCAKSVARRVRLRVHACLRARKGMRARTFGALWPAVCSGGRVSVSGSVLARTS